MNAGEGAEREKGSKLFSSKCFKFKMLQEK